MALDELKESSVNFRIPRSEREALERIAEQAGAETVSQFMRGVVRQVIGVPHAGTVVAINERDSR